MWAQAALQGGSVLLDSLLYDEERIWGNRDDKDFLVVHSDAAADITAADITAHGYRAVEVRPSPWYRWPRRTA